MRDTCQDSAQRKQGAVVVPLVLSSSQVKKTPFQRGTRGDSDGLSNQNNRVGLVGSDRLKTFQSSQSPPLLLVPLNFPGGSIFHCSYSVHPDWYQLFNLSPGDLILFLI